MAHINRIDIENSIYGDENKFLNLIENFIKILVIQEIRLDDFLIAPDVDSYVGGSFANNYIYSNKLNDYDKIHLNFNSDKAITNYNINNIEKSPLLSMLNSVYFNIRLKNIKDLIDSYDIDVYLKLMNQSLPELEKERIIKFKIEKLYTDLNKNINKFISGDDITKFAFNKSEYKYSYSIDSLFDKLKIYETYDKGFNFVLNHDLKNKIESLVNVKFELKDSESLNPKLVLISDKKLDNGKLTKNYVILKNVQNNINKKTFYNFDYIYLMLISYRIENIDDKEHYIYEFLFDKSFLKVIKSVENFKYNFDLYISSKRNYVNVSESTVYKNINGQIIDQENIKLFTFYLIVTKLPLDIHNVLYTKKFDSFKIKFLDINLLDDFNNNDYIPCKNLKFTLPNFKNNLLNISKGSFGTTEYFETYVNVKFKTYNLLNLLENNFYLFKKSKYRKREKSIIKFYLLKSLIDNDLLSNLAKTNLNQPENKLYLKNLFRKFKEYFKLLDYVKNIKIESNNSHLSYLIAFIYNNNLHQIYKTEDYQADNIIDTLSTIPSTTSKEKGIFKNIFANTRDDRGTTKPKTTKSVKSDYLSQLLIDIKTDNPEITKLQNLEKMNKSLKEFKTVISGHNFIIEFYTKLIDFHKEFMGEEASIEFINKYKNLDFIINDCYQKYLQFIKTFKYDKFIRLANNNSFNHILLKFKLWYDFTNNILNKISEEIAYFDLDFYTNFPVQNDESKKEFKEFFESNFNIINEEDIDYLQKYFSDLYEYLLYIDDNLYYSLLLADKEYYVYEVDLLKKTYYEIKKGKNLDYISILIIIKNIILKKLKIYNDVDLIESKLFNILDKIEYKEDELDVDIYDFELKDLSLTEFRSKESQITEMFVNDKIPNKKVDEIEKILDLFFNRVLWKFKLLEIIKYKQKNISDNMYTDGNYNNDMYYDNILTKLNELISKIVVFDKNLETPYKIVKKQAIKFKQNIESVSYEVIGFNKDLDPELLITNPLILDVEKSKDIYYVQEYLKLKVEIDKKLGDSKPEFTKKNIILFFGIYNVFNNLNTNINLQLFPILNSLFRVYLGIANYVRRLMTNKIYWTVLEKVVPTYNGIIDILIFNLNKRLLMISQNEIIKDVNSIMMKSSENPLNLINTLYKYIESKPEELLKDSINVDKINIYHMLIGKIILVVDNIDESIKTRSPYYQKLYDNFKIDIIDKFHKVLKTEVVDIMTTKLKSVNFTEYITNELEKQLWNLDENMTSSQYIEKTEKINDIYDNLLKDEKVIKILDNVKNLLDLFNRKYLGIFNLLIRISQLKLTESEIINVKLLKVYDDIMNIYNENIDSLDSLNYTLYNNKITEIIESSTIKINLPKIKLINMTGGNVETYEELLDLLCMINYETIEFRNLKTNKDKSTIELLNIIINDMKNLANTINDNNIRIQKGYILYGMPIESFEGNFDHTYNLLIKKGQELPNDLLIEPENFYFVLLSLMKETYIKLNNIDIDSNIILNNNNTFAETNKARHNTYLTTKGIDVINVFKNYTGTYYKTLNPCLQNLLNDTTLQKCNLKVVEDINLMLNAFSEVNNLDLGDEYMPLVSGKYYNIFNYQRNFDYKGIKTGDLFYFPQFMSTSYYHTTSDYTKFISNFGSVYLIFVKKSAKYIICKDFTNVPDENEILLPPGKLFFVKNYDLILNSSLQKINVFIYENIEKMNNLEELTNYYRSSINGLSIMPYDNSEIKIMNVSTEADNFVKQYDFDELKDNIELDKLIRYNVSPLLNIGSIKAKRIPDIVGVDGNNISNEAYGLVLDRDIVLHCGTTDFYKDYTRAFLSEITSAWWYAYDRTSGGERKLYSYYYKLNSEKKMILIDYLDERNLRKIYEYYLTASASDKSYLNTYFNFVPIRSSELRTFLVKEKGDYQEFYYNGEFISVKYYGSEFGNIKEDRLKVQKYSRDTADDFKTFDIIRDKIFKNKNINGYIARATLTQRHDKYSFNDEIMIYNNFNLSDLARGYGVKPSDFYFNPIIIEDRNIFLSSNDNPINIANSVNLLNKLNSNAFLLAMHKYYKPKNNRLLDYFYNNNIFGRVLDKEDYWYHNYYKDLHKIYVSIIEKIDQPIRDIANITDYPTEFANRLMEEIRQETITRGRNRVEHRATINEGLEIAKYYEKLQEDSIRDGTFRNKYVKLNLKKIL
jgi:hypothetical protein